MYLPAEQRAKLFKRKAALQNGIEFAQSTVISTDENASF